MGSWFANMNIRRSQVVTVDAVAQVLGRMLAERGYEAAASAEDADGVLALLAGEDSEWVTVCSDLLLLEEPEQFAAIGTILSGALHTDVLGIACFDSDFLWMNLLNVEQEIDGWVGIGSGRELGFTRRNKLTPWRKKVHDYARFARCAKEDYVLADGFLADTADLLGLPISKSSASVAYLKDLDPEGTAVSLYFRRREDARIREKVRMAHNDRRLPCLVGYESGVMAINQGAAGTGLKIWILISGAEREDVTYDNVYLRRRGEVVPIELTWAQMPDGRWAWCWHDPEFPIPPAVKGRMKKEKQGELVRQRQFSVHFTPKGNSRKTLDIQVGFVPDEHPDGGTWWNILQSFDTKEDFIKWHNKTWKWCWSMKDPCDDERGYLPLLKREDFD